MSGNWSYPETNFEIISMVHFKWNMTCAGIFDIVIDKLSYEY